jgi:hypothetical protein
MSDYKPQDGLLKPDRPVGIVGYGAYVPRYRLPATEVSHVDQRHRRHAHRRKSGQWAG